MAYTFPQMMSEIDPYHQFSQLQIDACYYTHIGTFGTHPHLGEPGHANEREKIKQDTNTKVFEISQDVTLGRARSAHSYAGDIIQKLTFPAAAYIAVYPV